MLTLRWLKELGGITAIEEINNRKATLLYSEIELNPLFKGFAAKEDRSSMNATFTLTDDDLKETFDAMWKEAGINGLNGHRSVGGYRASMYNALSIDSVGSTCRCNERIRKKCIVKRIPSLYSSL